jgi:hypothetical protein
VHQERTLDTRGRLCYSVTGKLEPTRFNVELHRNMAISTPRVESGREQNERIAVDHDLGATLTNGRLFVFWAALTARQT